MNLRRLGLGTVLLAAAFLNTGCIIIHSDGWGWGSTVWTEEVQERYELTADELNKIDVKTHNGNVDYTAGTGDAYVLVTKKAFNGPQGTLTVLVGKMPDAKFNGYVLSNEQIGRAHV